MRILAVDDDEISRKILCASLSGLGYHVVAADSGETALNIVKASGISIVIADWMMPGMSGLELCHEIRKLTNKHYVYIVLLTARKDRSSMLEGFEAGIDEFLEKPFDVATLEAHLKVGIRIVNLERGLTEAHDRIERYAYEMENLANERARQLFHADRMASIGILAAGVAHEVNNPTTFISGNAQMFQDVLPCIDRALAGVDEYSNDRAQAEFIRKELPAMIDGIRSGAQRISRIVSGLKSYAHQSKAQIVKVDVRQKIDDALALCSNALKYNVAVSVDCHTEKILVDADPQLLEQVFVNLFTNAADALAQTKNAALTIATSAENDRLVIKVLDNGPGISKEHLAKNFTPFFTTKPVGKGTGLGLPISLGIIEEMGGTMSVVNGSECGAVFRIELPITKPGS